MGSEKQTMTMTDTEKLIAAFTASIASLKPEKEIKEGDPEYVERLRAEGFYDNFAIPVYQNAYEAQARGLPKEVIERAAKLRSGNYIKTTANPMGRVEVTNDGKTVVISYPVLGDALMQNTQHWRDFPELINKIWDEMQAQQPVSA